MLPTGGLAIWRDDENILSFLFPIRPQFQPTNNAGSAKGRYKLDNIHDGGMAILGKTTSDFITMALELGK